MMTREEQTKFNDYCVRTMGFTTGHGCGEGAYYDQNGDWCYNVADYFPCQNVIQLLEVANVLMRDCGITAEQATNMADVGVEAGVRNYIHECMYGSETKIGGHIIHKGNLRETLDLSNHSITVETLQEAIDGAYTIGYPIAITARGVTESQGFVAHNERDFITMAYDALLSSSDDRITINAFEELSDEEAIAVMEEDYSWCAPEPCDILDCEEGWDAFDKIFKEVVHPMYENDGDDPQDKFNTQCRGIMFKHTSTVLPQDFDPYYNGTQLIYVLETLLRYLPNSIHCMIAAGQKDMENNEDITHGLDVTWHMRKFIESYGTDEWMMTEEAQFIKLCTKIKTTFQSDGYCLEGNTYDPYNNHEQLMGIVELVVQNSQQPFVMQNACGGPPDMMGVMRGFVTKYSDEQYLPELYVTG